MAHYEMYLCVPKTAWETAVGDKIKAQYPLVESQSEEGELTYISSPTWHQLVYSGKVGNPRWSHDNSYCIIKGEWSMKEGVLSELAALGAGKSYPEFSILTKSEVLTLINSSTFTGE